ncbi:MAG: hypothetical protein RLY93_00255 [Sumerlaeia bacterium]
MAALSLAGQRLSHCRRRVPIDTVRAEKFHVRGRIVIYFGVFFFGSFILVTALFFFMGVFDESREP